MTIITVRNRSNHRIHNTGQQTMWVDVIIEGNSVRTRSHRSAGADEHKFEISVKAAEEILAHALIKERDAERVAKRADSSLAFRTKMATDILAAKASYERNR